ncbi:MAG: cell division protein SepF [Lachnospiraceae bacterium]
MGKFGGLLRSMGIVSDPDEDIDDDFDEFDNDDYEEEDKPKRKLFGKKEAADDDDDDEPAVKPAARPARQAKVVPMKSGKGLEVCVIKPTSIDDAREITDTLLSGKAVVLNFEGVHVEVAQRIIDFTSGSSYSIDGNLQKITNYIFIATPSSVEVSGDLQNLLAAGSVNVGV